MRIVIHDYAGHPFQAQLSRELARRGHEVLHLYSASNPTPKGALARRDRDPANFEVEGLSLAGPYQRYAYFRRWRHERAYGRLLAERIGAWRPDLVICCNTPLDALATLHRRCRRMGIRLIFWIQDLLGLAAWRILRSRIPGIGALIGRYHIAKERRLARGSDALVLITEDFAPIMREWGVEDGKVHVIEDWAPLDELPPSPRDNEWARGHGLTDRLSILYTGMMGLKHNPGLVLKLACHFRDRPEIATVVVSEGLGADWLAARKADLGLDNLILLGFQPYDQLAKVMGSGDILLAILEPEAGVFSVPSKVMSYLCAGRPILAAIPPENLAAKIITANEAGLVVHPNDAGAFLEAAERLIAGRALRQRLGQNALDYATRTFNIEAIGTRFETVIRQAAE